MAKRYAFRLNLKKISKERKGRRIILYVGQVRISSLYVSSAITQTKTKGKVKSGPGVQRSLLCAAERGRQDPQRNP